MPLLPRLLLAAAAAVAAVSAREVVFGIFGGKIRMDKFLTACPEARQRTFPLYYENLTVADRGGQLRIGYDVVNGVPALSAPLTMMVDLQRCNGRENPDSCIRFASFKTSRLCNLLESTKEFWSPMVTCATPRFHCPIAKGIYRGRNCSLDMSSFNWFPLGDSYWKVKVRIAVQPSVVVACVLVEGQFTKH